MNAATLTETEGKKVRGQENKTLMMSFEDEGDDDSRSHGKHDFD